MSPNELFHTLASLSISLSLYFFPFFVSYSLFSAARGGKVLLVGGMTDNKSPSSTVCVGSARAWLSLSHLFFCFSSQHDIESLAHQNKLFKISPAAPVVGRSVLRWNAPTAMENHSVLFQRYRGRIILYDSRCDFTISALSSALISATALGHLRWQSFSYCH